MRGFGDICDSKGGYGPMTGLYCNAISPLTSVIGNYFQYGWGAEAPNAIIDRQTGRATVPVQPAPDEALTDPTSYYLDEASAAAFLKRWKEWSKNAFGPPNGSDFELFLKLGLVLGAIVLGIGLLKRR